VGLRPLIRATRFRAKHEYIPVARQKQDTAGYWKGPISPSRTFQTGTGRPKRLYTKRRPAAATAGRRL